MIPWITSVLDETQLGYYLLIRVIVVLLLPVYSLGFESALVIKFYKLNDRAFGDVLESSLTSYILRFILITLFFYLVDFKTSEYFNLEKYVFVTIAVIAGMEVILNLSKNLMRVSNRRASYAAIVSGQILLYVGFSMYIYFYHEKTWYAFLVALFLSYVTVLFLLGWILLKRYSLRLKFSRIAGFDLLKIGLPISLNDFGNNLLGSYGKIFISSELGAKDLGQYGIAGYFSAFLTILDNGINKALGPEMYRLLKLGEKRNVRSLITKVNIVYILIALLIYLTQNYLGQYLFSERYLGVKYMVLPLLLGACLKGLSKFYTHTLFFYEKTYILPVIMIMSNMVLFTMIFVLFPSMGVLGVIYANIMSSLSYLVCLFILHKYTILNA